MNEKSDLRERAREWLVVTKKDSQYTLTRRLIVDLLQALDDAEREEGERWQSIETAPKDKLILLYMPEFGASAETWWPGLWSWKDNCWAIRTPFMRDEKLVMATCEIIPLGWREMPAAIRREGGRDEDRYDAGLLSDFGGGNVEWWQDYIRSELGRSHDFYEDELATLRARLTEVEGELSFTKKQLELCQLELEQTKDLINQGDES